MKTLATWRKCSDTNEHHALSDFCLACAPFWDSFPICAEHSRKLPKSGFCRDCRKYLSLVNRPA